ncbi:DUF3533 domain-containing protein [Streptomyces sp. AJS327]|uniref:DUF3533 domain-containing protein n=1 Tax=Streptomyces sp. AJS327 TaxID=2545265 RepID=UPI00215558CC|nr:DUF3533 domain-containing protein [Streptomyces sp. AJS327]
MRQPPFVAELRDAITPRALLLMVAVFLVQLAFLVSYIGAFHHPEPQRVPLAVAGPQQLAERLDALPGRPVETDRVSGQAAARDRVLHREADAAYVMNPSGTRDTLLVASAGGQSVADAVTRIGEEVARKEGRTLDVRDIVPAGKGDQGSLTAFYLVIGWLVGGYLAASMLGVTVGARPSTGPRAVIRLAAMAVYAALSGLGGAVLVGPVLDALPGHFGTVWGVGTLVVFGAASVTIGLQTLFGVIGIGLAILVFVVLGNPSAGGAYQAHMIPPFWRAVGEWLPTGAGVSAVRNAVYFAGHAVSGPLLVLAVWAVAGVALTAIGSLWGRDRRHGPGDGPGGGAAGGPGGGAADAPGGPGAPGGSGVPGASGGSRPNGDAQRRG